MQELFEYGDALTTGPVKGRGAGLNPGNRYEKVRLHILGDHLDELAQAGDPSRPRTQVFLDDSKTILNRVDSPDIPFNWTINPYRGCEHGCIYCYARPGHEQLGFSCGLDFETKIMAKPNAPRKLAQALAKPSWKAETISMSGVTDCYQPIERKMKITRGCLEVFAQARQPVSIITKNKLILRDLDLLKELAAHHAVRVAISLTTLDRKLAMKMEPRTSSPSDRLEMIARFHEAGVPVVAMMAPIIPAINDREIPKLLQVAREAGAQSAGYTLLRLPYQVEALFTDWLGRAFPDRAEHVLSLLRQTRGGKLNDGRFGKRMRGEGPIAEQIRTMFRVYVRKHDLNRSHTSMSGASFRRPTINGQMGLF